MMAILLNSSIVVMSGQERWSDNQAGQHGLWSSSSMPHIQYDVLSLAALQAARPFYGSGGYVPALHSGDLSSMSCQWWTKWRWVRISPSAAVPPVPQFHHLYYCRHNDKRARPGGLQKTAHFAHRRHTGQAGWVPYLSLVEIWNTRTKILSSAVWLRVAKSGNSEAWEELAASMLTVAKWSPWQYRQNFLRNLSISLPVCTVSPSQRPLSSCLVSRGCGPSAIRHLKLKICCFQKLALAYQTRRCHQPALHSRLYLVMIPFAAILDCMSLSAATVHETHLVLLIVKCLFIVTGAGCVH